MAADYIGEILNVQPSGPFRLVGNCIGGVVAFEVAQQLRHQGHHVSTLVLMDTDYPSHRLYARYRWRRLRDYFARQLETLYYYQRRLSHHQSELKARRWREKLGYVAGRTRTVVRDSMELQNPAEMHKQSYQQTLRRYRPVPYDGAAQFIVSEEDHRDDPIGAWAQMVRGSITILQAPGDHEAYIRDHVAVVGEQLRLCLQEESEQRL
jgi:thioesterase domain-containing protein